MSNFIITGCNGFIGKNLIEYLLLTKKFKKLYLIYRKFEQVPKQILENKNIIIIICDLYKNKNLLKKYNLKEFTLIHLAWSNLPNYTSSVHLKNLKEEIKLFNFLKNKLKKIIITGTCFEYGNRYGEVSERCKKKPMIQYAIAKNSLRKYLFKCNEFKVTWLRLFYVYGKYQNNKSLIPQLLINCKRRRKVFHMSDGTQIRDFINIDLVVKYLLLIANKKKIKGEINICSGKKITIKKFVENFCRKKRLKIKLQFNKKNNRSYESNFYGSNKKLKKILMND